MPLGTLGRVKIKANLNTSWIVTLVAPNPIDEEMLCKWMCDLRSNILCSNSCNLLLNPSLCVVCWVCYFPRQKYPKIGCMPLGTSGRVILEANLASIRIVIPLSMKKCYVSVLKFIWGQFSCLISPINVLYTLMRSNMWGHEVKNMFDIPFMRSIYTQFDHTLTTSWPQI